MLHDGKREHPFLEVPSFLELDQEEGAHQEEEGAHQEEEGDHQEEEGAQLPQRRYGPCI